MRVEHTDAHLGGRHGAQLSSLRCRFLLNGPSIFALNARTGIKGCLVAAKKQIESCSQRQAVVKLCTAGQCNLSQRGWRRHLEKNLTIHVGESWVHME